jgi:ABC-2 type transport system ATP-binding protein
VDLAENGAAIVVTDPDAQLIRQEGRRFFLSFDPQRIAVADLIARIARQYPVHDLFVENPPIEAIVARLYEHRSKASAQ